MIHQAHRGRGFLCPGESVNISIYGYHIWGGGGGQAMMYGYHIRLSGTR